MIVLLFHTKMCDISRRYDDHRVNFQYVVNKISRRDKSANGVVTLEIHT